MWKCTCLRVEANVQGEVSFAPASSVASGSAAASSASSAAPDIASLVEKALAKLSLYISPYIWDDRDDQGTHRGSINRPGRRLIVLDVLKATRLNQPS
jgi:hypothetical protein